MTHSSLRINSFDDSNYPLTPFLAAPGTLLFQFRGGASQPFALFRGTLAAGTLNAGSIGLVDLDFTQSDFETLTNGLAPQTALDLLSVLDGTGAADFPIVLAPGMTGAFGAMQALVADPGSATGLKLTAANALNVVAGWSLSLVTPPTGTPAGGDLVSIVGTGFTPGSPVSVQFGGFTAPFATISNSTIILATTPASFPGQQIDVTVTHTGMTTSLPAAFTYAPVAHQTVLVNEIFTGEPDYVELFNPNPIPVDISGWSLHSWYHGTTPDSGSPYFFPFGSFIPALGFMVVQEMGQAHLPGTLPASISTGSNFWWTGTREVEVALVDNLGLGVDYVHHIWNGGQTAPNMPFPLSWTGVLTSPEDATGRNSVTDTDDASDFTTSATGTPGMPNPGQ